MKKYWYYTCQYPCQRGIANACGVMSALDDFFPLTEIRSQLQERYNTKAVVINFWSEISEATYHEFVKNAEKA